jgi:hypothetical protein
VATTYSLSPDQHTVIVHPTHRLEPDTRYQLYLTVYGFAGELAANSVSFWTVSDATMPVAVTGFALDMGPGWHADWNTTSMTFRWNTQSGVDGYRVYARDTAAKTDFVLVKTVAANEAVTYQTTTVNLATAPFNTIFDVYEGDGIQTPFTAGRDVIFQIAAYNDAGEGTFSTAVTVSDQTAPTGALGSQSGTANNTAGTEPDTITVRLTASEYLNFDRPPVWEMQEAGGDPAYHLPPSALSFEWDANVMGGTITLIIPTGHDASGDRLTLDDEFEDSSGNEVDTAVELILF